MPLRYRPTIALTGGVTGAVDKIPSSGLQNTDSTLCVSLVSGAYFYALNSTSGAAENLPGVIKPDDETGDPRWILQGLTVVDLTSSGGRVRNTTRKISTDSPYTILATDEVLYFNTDGGAIRGNLLAGVEGRHHKLINCGSSGNDVDVYPNGAERVYGQAAGIALTLTDGDVLDIDFNSVEGWW